MLAVHGLLAAQSQFAAGIIAVLRWWALLAPLGALAALFLSEHARARLSFATVLVSVSPPMLVLAPAAVMHVGAVRLVAAAAVVCDLGAAASAVVGLLRDRRHRQPRATFAALAALAGALLGTLALLLTAGL